MPEGDTLARAVRTLEPLIGSVITATAGSHPAIRREGRRLCGRKVTGVRSMGKHLIIGFNGGWSLRTHLGMSGSWHLYPPGARWRLTPGKARVVLHTDTHVAVCSAAPTVEVAPDATVERSISSLGPDILDDAFRGTAAAERAAASNAHTVSELLLDQHVACGIGNVYRNEILFLERVHPETPVETLSAATIARLFDRGHRLLTANVRDPRRTTTGTRGHGRRMWVYGRAGRTCRRCNAPISYAAGNTAGARLTFWCPGCQPAPRTRSDGDRPRLPSPHPSDP